MNSKTRLIVTILLILSLILAFTGYSLFKKSPDTAKELSKQYEKSFDMKDVGKNGVMCQSLSPECGYCPGETLDTVCYYNENQL